jgi:hypothetical protein
MRITIAIAAFLVAGTTSAQELQPRSAVGDAIGRGLAFLTRDALAWKEQHNCASCHHASLVVWSMQEAKRLGHAVDEPVLAELTKWMAESGDGKFTLARPASAPNAASPKAMYFALALGMDPKPDATAQEGMKRLLTTVAAEQTGNGSWSTWPETRPPLFGNSDESLTALAALALLPAAASGDVAARTTLEKGVRWLAETKSDQEPQSIALRLVLWIRLERPAAEWKPLVRSIEDRQNADGGWSQARDMASDAWATGQALYALALSGNKTGTPAIDRGQAFLVKTQRLADDIAACQAGRRRIEKPHSDYRWRQRMGRPGAGAQPMTTMPRR